MKSYQEIKRSQSWNFKWLLLTHLFCQHLPFPAWLNYKFCLHFVGRAAFASPESHYRSGSSVPTSREGPELPLCAMCPGIWHAERRGAGVEMATKPQLSPSPTSGASAPYLGFSFYSLCVHSLNGNTAQPSTQSIGCLALACPSSLLFLIPLVIAWNTAHALQMTQNRGVITWLGLLLFHCRQTLSQSPIQPDQKIPLVSVPSWIKSEFSGLFWHCHFDCWPLSSGISSLTASVTRFSGKCIQASLWILHTALPWGPKTPDAPCWQSWRV